MWNPGRASQSGIPLKHSMRVFPLSYRDAERKSALRKLLSLALSVILILTLLPCPVSAEERVVLTIADTTERSGNRYNADLSMWQYLAEKVGVEIDFSYITPEEYESRLATGDLPDIVATCNNLSKIPENGVASDAFSVSGGICPKSAQRGCPGDV